ncbi:hypothetical protein [Massilia sp. Se16.2.3]|uniref:hypothetical protein n=1 Tax=Massilia sp. Se16.2.3 TaxID=2709303 RepID=UPI001E2D6600|nr:hypothetical protein [Massilia sp. Se16.2.3]
MRFLKGVGMPTEVLYNVPPPPLPARTDFARVDDVEAVPFLSENGRRAYADYLTKMTPRAFAVSPSGAWTGPRRASRRKRARWPPARRKAPRRASCIRSTIMWCGMATVSMLRRRPR